MIHHHNPISVNHRFIKPNNSVKPKSSRLYNRVQSKFPKTAVVKRELEAKRVSPMGQVSYEPCIKPSEVRGKEHPLSVILEKENRAKELVATMRNNIQSSLLQEKFRGEHAKEIGEFSGEALRSLLKQLLEEGEEVLKNTYGKKPCEYSCAVFGSTARDDGGAYPDLDYVFLIEKETPKNVKYFEMLSQYVGDRIYQLGESTPGSNYGIHPCYGGATPLFKNWGWRYQSPESSQQEALSPKREICCDSTQQMINERLFGNQKEQELQHQYGGPVPSRTRGTAVLIGEPRSIARWAQPGTEKRLKRKAREISAKHDQSVQVLQRQIANIAGYTDIRGVDNHPQKEALVQKFLDQRARLIHKKSSAETISAKDHAKESIEAHVYDHAQENFVKVTLPDSQSFSKSLPSEGLVDIKKGFWRFPQVLIASLSEMHGVREMNTFKRIDALEGKGIFTKPYAEKLRKTYAFLVSLRSKCQMHYKCELHKVFRSEGAKQRYINEFETKEGMSVEELIAKTKKEIESYHREVEKINEQAISSNNTLNTRQLKGLIKKRKALYNLLEECNHMQAYKNGLVLDAYERRMFDKQVIPFLQESQEHVEKYVKNSTWTSFA